MPQKARRPDGSGYFRYDPSVLDEGTTATAYALADGYLVLLRTPGREPTLVSVHVATVRERSVEDVLIHRRISSA